MARRVQTNNCSWNCIATPYSMVYRDKLLYNSSFTYLSSHRSKCNQSSDRNFINFAWWRNTCSSYVSQCPVPMSFQGPANHRNVFCARMRWNRRAYMLDLQLAVRLGVFSVTKPWRPHPFELLLLLLEYDDMWWHLTSNVQGTCFNSNNLVSVCDKCISIDQKNVIIFWH